MNYLEISGLLFHVCIAACIVLLIVSVRAARLDEDQMYKSKSDHIDIPDGMFPDDYDDDSEHIEKALDKMLIKRQKRSNDNTEN